MVAMPALDGRILLVTGPQSFQACGAGEYFAGTQFVRFAGSGPNPTMADVERGRAVLEANGFDQVVTVGGGSVIDLAKLINMRRKPLLAIPTTAGTGAEVTSFAAVYINGVKRSVGGLRPDGYLLEPGFLRTVPRYAAICAGLDALCQSIESLWSRQASVESKIYAERSAQLALEHLEPAVEGSAGSQAKMQEAANLSGRAIDISKTTASHALSYFMTARFGIPHGHAVALTIDALRARNANPDVERLLGRTSISALMRRLGIRTRFCEFGIGEAEIEQIAGEVDAERLANNPVPLNCLDRQRSFRVRGIMAGDRSDEVRSAVDAFERQVDAAPSVGGRAAGDGRTAIRGYGTYGECARQPAARAARGQSPRRRLFWFAIRPSCSPHAWA